MKKLITLLLSVCLLVTLMPALAFADESDGQQDAGQVVQMESQEDPGQVITEPQTEPQDEATSSDLSTNDPAEDAQQSDDPSERTMQGKTVTDPAELEEDEVNRSVIRIAGIDWTVDASGWKCSIDGSPCRSNIYPISGGWYLFNDAGYLQTGLQSFGGATYYFNPVGQNPKIDSLGRGMTGWIQVPGRGTCYFDPMNSGHMVTGLQNIGGYTYYFAANGAMLTGWQQIGSGKYYFGSNGAMKKGWLALGSVTYYLGADGAMKTGWQKISGDMYYFNTSSGAMLKGGPVKIGKSKYFFNTSNGKMVKGFQMIGGKKYFFSTSNGAMMTGWLTYSGKKYYLNSNGTAKVNCLATIKGNRYYFQSDGSMMKNKAVKVKGKLYYFKKNGKGQKKKGWFKGSDGGKRYSLGKGRVQTGKKKIKGVWYKFNKSTGILEKKIGDSFDASIQSQTSQTQYLITINRAKYELRVYQGKKNNWTRIKKMDCGIGATATPTPAGSFITTARMQNNTYSLNGTKVRYWYHTQFQSSDNKGIHSGLYYADTGNEYDTTLRTKSSQGSVRVALSNAEWIYYNVPLYTTVYVK